MAISAQEWRRLLRLRLAMTLRGGPCSTGIVLVLKGVPSRESSSGFLASLEMTNFEASPHRPCHSEYPFDLPPPFSRGLRRMNSATKNLVPSREHYSIRRTTCFCILSFRGAKGAESPVCWGRSARSDEKSLKRSGSQIKNLGKGSIRFITRKLTPFVTETTSRNTPE